MDIIVTTPKSQMANAAKEAEDCKKAGGGYYFRRLNRYPKRLRLGDRVWYVEDGYIRGFAVAVRFISSNVEIECDTTNAIYPPGTYVFMTAEFWKWIKPIPYRGFQGWRYYTPPQDFEVVGGWLDPRPAT